MKQRDSFEKERNEYFDILRVTAMIAVMGVHICGSLITEEMSGGVTVIIEHFNSLGVFSFFAISGYFALKDDCDNITVYYKKRFLRILIPYFVYAWIYTIYFTGVERRDWIGILVGRNSYLMRIITANVHGTHWYVYAILFFYLCVPYICRMLKGFSREEIKKMYYSVFLLLVICSFVNEMRMRLGIYNLVDFESVIWLLKVVLLFSTGYFVNEILKYRFHPLLKWGGGIVAFFAYCFDIPLAEYVLLMIIMQKGGIKVRSGAVLELVDHLVRQSYSIYLVHAAVLALLLKLVKQFEIYLWGKIFVLYILVILCSYFITCIFDWMITMRLRNVIKRVVKY